VYILDAAAGQDHGGTDGLESTQKPLHTNKSMTGTTTQGMNNRSMRYALHLEIAAHLEDISHEAP
jgi:hypothetical protein